MADLLVSFLAAGVVLGAFFTLRSASERKKVAASLALFEVGNSRPRITVRQRKPLFEGIAGRIAGTSVGSRLYEYCTTKHPHTTFSDFVAIMLASAIGGLLAGQVFFREGPLVLVASIGAVVGANRYMLRRQGRRISRLEAGLPQALFLQSSALRAGSTVVRSLRVIREEAPAPLSNEVSEVLLAVDLGTPLDEALETFSKRNPSHYLDLWLTTMQVHHMTGGNLAVSVENLAKRLQEMVQLRRDLRTMTAQGRLSGLVVAFAPIAFFVFLSATSREQMRILYTTPIGLTILSIGVALEVLGFIWIRYILRGRT